MNKAQKIFELTHNKTRKVPLTFNAKLWELFKSVCEADNVTPTNKFEFWMIGLLEEKGLLKDDES